MSMGRAGGTARRRTPSWLRAGAARAGPPERIELDDPRLTVAVRRTRAAVRLSLSVSRLDGAVRLTAPPHCTDKAARAFLDRHRDWLRDTAGSALGPIVLGPGVVAPVLGVERRIALEPSRRGARLDDVGGEKRLVVGGRAGAVGARAMAFVKELARAELAERSRGYAERLGVRFSKISLRDTRSRWGSCSSTGALSYSWRLGFAPIDVLDYVAAHEVAHLLELNHSARFWAHVERLRPDWRAHRAWLREHGASLHRYRAAA